MRIFYSSLTGALLAFPLAVPSLASDPPKSDTPTPVAATRPELKEQLERSKQSHPRLPLPPPTEAAIPFAVLVIPPPTIERSPQAALPEPPPTAELFPPAVL